MKDGLDNFQQALEASPCGILVVSRRGAILLVNRAIERDFGYERRELLGKRFDLLMPERFRQTHHDTYLPRLFADPKRRVLGEQTDLWGLRKDGVEIPLDIELSPIEFGGELCMLAAIMDLTERKALEREKQKMEQEAQSAQRLESLGVLAGGVAHEFNNLLQVISFHADLALPLLPPDSPARADLQQIQGTVQKAAQLSSQMLAYAGKRSFVVERIDLNRVVGEMLELLEALISKEAALTFSATPGLSPIQAEPAQVQQVITNLVKNAAEAMDNGEGTITISTSALRVDDANSPSEEHDAPVAGEYVVLEVADTGRGMNDATLSRIFEPFFSTDPDARGLGLAAVLGLVRAHHGYVKVASQPREGSVFRVLFPAVQGAARSDRVRRRDSLPDGLARGTVLLIDDEEAIRFAGRRMLEALGFRVLTAADGAEGLERYRRNGNEIDCVLLDLTMPGLSGRDVFTELRSIRPDVQVVIASGYGAEEITRRFEGDEPAGVIQKPYGRKDLAHALRAVPGPQK